MIGVQPPGTLFAILALVYLSALPSVCPRPYSPLQNSVQIASALANLAQALGDVDHSIHFKLQLTLANSTNVNWECRETLIDRVQRMVNATCSQYNPKDQTTSTWTITKGLTDQFVSMQTALELAAMCASEDVPCSVLNMVYRNLSVPVKAPSPSPLSVLTLDRLDEVTPPETQKIPQWWRDRNVVRMSVEFSDIILTQPRRELNTRVEDAKQKWASLGATDYQVDIQLYPCNPCMSATISISQNKAIRGWYNKPVRRALTDKELRPYRGITCDTLLDSVSHAINTHAWSISFNAMKEGCPAVLETDYNERVSDTNARYQLDNLHVLVTKGGNGEESPGMAGIDTPSTTEPVDRTPVIVAVIAFIVVVIGGVIGGVRYWKRRNNPARQGYSPEL